VGGGGGEVGGGWGWGGGGGGGGECGKERGGWGGEKEGRRELGGGLRGSVLSGRGCKKGTVWPFGRVTSTTPTPVPICGSLLRACTKKRLQRRVFTLNSLRDIEALQALGKRTSAPRTPEKKLCSRGPTQMYEEGPKKIHNRGADSQKKKELHREKKGSCLQNGVFPKARIGLG